MMIKLVNLYYSGVLKWERAEITIHSPLCCLIISIKPQL